MRGSVIWLNFLAMFSTLDIVGIYYFAKKNAVLVCFIIHLKFVTTEKYHEKGVNSRLTLH